MRFPWMADAALSAGLALSCVAGGSGRNNASGAQENSGEQHPHDFLVSAPAMSASRAAHTATAVPDGRVPIPGGFVEKAPWLAHQTQDGPLLPQGLLVEKHGPANGHSRRGSDKHLLVGKKEEVLAQVFLGELFRAPAIMPGKPSHRFQAAFLSTCSEPP